MMRTPGLGTAAAASKRSEANEGESQQCECAGLGNTSWCGDVCAGNDVHVATATAEEAPVQIGVDHRQDVIRGEDYSLKRQGQWKARSVVVEAYILAAGREIPQDLVSSQAASERNIAAQVHV